MSLEAHAVSATEEPAKEPAAPPVDFARDAALLEHEAGLSPPALAARLLHHAGHLFEVKVGDRENARRLFIAAAEVDAAYRPAVDSLRQLCAAAGEWETVAGLYARELSFARDNAARFEIMRAQAGVYARRLDRPDLAAQIYGQAFALAPDSPLLLDWAIAEAAAKGDAPREVELRVKLAHALRDEKLKARQLSRAAAAAEAAGDAATARTLRGELLQISPTDLEAQASTLPALHAAADVGALERVARAEVDASSSSPPRVRLARLLAERRGGVDEALELLQSAREINPRDGLALETLIDVLARQGDTARYETNLLARLDGARDPLDKAGAALRLARHLGAAGRGDEARAFYARALELVPGHPEAAAATAQPAGPVTFDVELGRLDAALAGEADPARKADLLCQLGLVLEDLGRADEAASRYLDALGAAPANLGLRTALVRLYERAQRWQELASFYEKEYLTAPDEGHGRDALVEMADLLETRLHDLAGAQAAYRRALELRADATAARGLVRCAQTTNKPLDLVFGLEQEAGCLADAPRRRAALLHRAAEIYAGELARPKDAVRLFERLLAEDAADAPARRALDAIGRAHPDLVPPKPLVEEPGSAELSAGLALAARQWDDAARLFAGVLAKRSDHPTGWADYARLQADRGDFASAVDALERYAALLTDGISRADVLLRAAELAEERLCDPTRAARLVEAAVLVAPRHVASWRLVSRFALARGDVARAVQALEQESTVAQLKDRTTALRRLASLLADRVGDRPRAIALHRQIVDEDSSDLWSIAELERLYRDAGEPAKSAEFRSRFAARCSDVRAGALLRTTAAEDRAKAGDVDGAINEYRRALAVDGRIRTAIDEVLLALKLKGDRAGLVDLYQRMAPFLDNDSQAVLALLRGEMHEADGQTTLALKCYRDAVAADAALLPAMRGARRLHEAAGEWNEARALLAQEGEAHVDKVLGVQLIVRAGEIAEEQVHDVEVAEGHYLSALVKIPGEPRAMSRLDALLRPQGRFAELVTIYEREGEAVTDDAPRGADLYAEAAWLRYEKLGEDRRAAVPLNRALSRDPACARALELKAVLALAAGNAAEAEEALAAAMGASTGAKQARILGRLAQARLATGNAAGALEAAQAALTAEPSNEHLELVLTAATAAGAQDVASQAVERLLVTAPDRIAGARFARLGAQARRSHGDVEGASGLYRRALDFLPGDPEAIEGLEKMHLDAGDFGGLAAAYESLASTSAADPNAARQYLTKAAGVWEKSGAPVRAAAVFQNALKTDPHNGPLRLALARTLSQSAATRSQAVAELRTLVASTAVQAEPVRELLRLFEADGRRDAAFIALGCLAATNHATGEERAQYTQLAARLPAGPSAALSADEIEPLIHPGERSSPVREVFAAIGPALVKVVAGNIDRHGLGRGDRVKGDVRTAADRVAKIFGVGDFELYSAARTPLDAWVENTETPSLVVGSGVIQRGSGELLFTLGQLLGHLRLRTQAAFFAQPIEVANLVAEALRQVDPSFSRFGTRNEQLAQLVSRAFGRSERKALEPLLPRFAGAVNFGAFTWGMAYTSHRFGLCTAGDPLAAVRVITRDNGRPQPPLEERADVRELIAFAVSEEHLALRQKLRIALA